MEINEEALIEHIFDICDEYGLGFIHRSTFLTTLKFNEEIQAAVTGSKVLKAIGKDHRIGNSYLGVGTKYSGQCFTRDNKALHFFIRKNNMILIIIDPIGTYLGGS